MTEAATDASTIEVSPDAGALAAVEVTIEGENTQVREVAGDASGKPGAKEVTPEAGIDELKRSLSESRAREQAEAARRQAAEAQVADAGRNALDANIAMVASEIEAAKAASKDARAEYQKALEKADYAAASDAQEKLADSRFNLLRLQERKAEIEQAKTRPAPQPQQDPVEAIASQLSPKAADWVRAHPEMAKQWKKVETAHNSAIELSGLTADTPEYFAKVEDLLGIRAAPRAEPEVIRIRQPSAQAPAQRETVSLRSGQPERQTITLSAQEREMAREMGMSDKEYALEKLAAIRDGQIKAN